jgi:3-isopropylmalate dehydratase small subunit
MIYHNKYLTITEIDEMGKYTFDNLEGYEDFAGKAKGGDIVVAGKNFGSGSSRQQAVDCFTSLGVQCIIAESFGAIYERNAINAAFPIIVCKEIKELKIKDGNELSLNFKNGTIRNLSADITVKAEPFSDVQMEIYLNNGLF